MYQKLKTEVENRVVPVS